MSSLPNVTLAGATGNLGEPILKALLTAQFHVTVLTRQGSNSTSKLPQNANLTIKEVNYTSHESLTSALKGSKVVISTLATESAGIQKTVIDAAVSAGVSRFIPSEFGSDLSNSLNAALPVFGAKVEVAKYLQEKVAEHPDFSYTLIRNGGFLDWGLAVGFLVNTKDHTATLYDGGDRPVSLSRLSTIAQAVVGVLKNLDTTANKEVYIHDVLTTQNKIISIANKIDDANWNTTSKNTKDIEQESYVELNKEGEKDIGKVMIGFIMVSLFGEGHGGDFSSKLWNEKLGLKTLSEAEGEAVIEDIIRTL